MVHLRVKEFSFTSKLKLILLIPRPVPDDEINLMNYFLDALFIFIITNKKEKN